MWHRLTVWVLLLAGIVCLAQQRPTSAYWQTRDSAYNNPPASGGGFTPSCTESGTYIAATTSLDTTHKTAVDTLICGRVTSGVFAKLDVWNMLATTAGADGLINMVTPGTFNSTLIGAPTFTGDVGYNSDDSSSTKAIDTHYNPSTSGGHFTNGAAGHASFWSMDNAAATGGGGFVMGLANADTTYYSLMIARSASDVAFWSTNSQAFPAAVGGMTNSSGHYVSVRTTTGANEFGYKNAVDQSIGAHSDGTPPSGNIYVLGINLWTTGVSAVFGASALRISTYSIGGALTSGDVTDLCHATNVYLTTISGVSAGVC